VGAASGPATGGFGIAGGTVGGSAMISADHGYFSSGQINGSVVLRFTGDSSRPNYTNLLMSGGTILNEGTFTQSYQANYDLDNSDTSGGGKIQNNGTWNLNNSSNFQNSYGDGKINNAGTLNQAGGSNSINALVTNSGTINASAGTLILSGGSTHTGSLITNSHIILSTGNHTLAGASACLAGAGALSGNLSISNGAKISPGNPSGTLTLYGAVSFVAGGAHPTCAVELAGPSTSDQINIASGANLDLGSNLTDLLVTLQYVPSYGDTFRIVSSGGSGHYTGTFRNMPTSSSVITATYGGQTYHLGISYDGTGKTVDLTVLSPYLAWANGKGLYGADAAFNADPDADGIANGIEFVIGGEPNPSNPNSNSQNLLPQIVVDPTYLRVSYRRNDESIYLTPGIEFNAALVNSWTTAQVGEHGVLINVVDDGYGFKMDRVEVLIPRSNEVNGKLFGRLKVSSP
jgi:hypothetical protein